MTRLMEMHPEIERVLLFGSLSRGEAVPGSDADVLLVLRDCALPFEKRGGHYFPRDAGIGVDVFAYTRAELDAMCASGHAFVIQALRESMVLVARDHSVEEPGGVIISYGEDAAPVSVELLHASTRFFTHEGEMHVTLQTEMRGAVSKG